MSRPVLACDPDMGPSTATNSVATVWLPSAAAATLTGSATSMTATSIANETGAPLREALLKLTE
jgi:hypothetical protein